MTKVLHIALSDNIGGIETFIFNLSAKIGDEVEFYYVAKSALDKKYIQELKNTSACANVYYYTSEMNVVGYINTLCKALDGCDVVHLHKNSLANIIPIIICLIKRKRMILHSHNTLPKVNWLIVKWMHYINRWFVGFLDIERIACSQKAGEWLFCPRQFEIIKNGIDIEKYMFNWKDRLEIRTKLGVADNELLIGHVGSLIEQKNHKYLLAIYEEIRKYNKNVKLLLIGDGPLQKKIEDEIITNGWNDDVLCVKRTREVEKYLSAMDVFLLPSQYEGLPISAIEAQASGLHVGISNNVDHDVRITDRLHFFDVDKKNIDKWVGFVLENAGQKDNFVKHTREIRLELFDKYNVINTINDLKKIYGKWRKR